MLTDPILDQNKRLRIRVAELEEEVRQLKDAAVFDGDIPGVGGRLSVSEEAILRMLMARRGVVSSASILTAIGSEATSNVAAVHISRLRHKLAGSGITICTRHGRGWYIERASHRMAVAGDLRHLATEGARL